MKRAAKALFAAVLAAFSFVPPAWAQAPGFPINMPPNTVYGRSGISTGPGQAIPFSVLIQALSSVPNTWTGVQSFIGGNVAPITADGAQVVVQNSSLDQSTMFAPVTGGVVYDGLRSTVYIPPGSTVLNAEPFGCYVRSRSGSNLVGNGVCYYGLITAGASNTSAWFLNGRLVDSEDALGHGYTGVNLIYSEADYFITSAGTSVEGYNISFASTLNFAGGNAFQVTNLTPSFGKLTNTFVSGDAAAATALVVGATVTSATAGVGSASQKIVFNWWNQGTPSIEKASVMLVDAGGQLNFPGNINLNTAVSTQVLLQFQQNSAAGWQIGQLANGNFFAFDAANSAFVWQMPSAGTLAFTPLVSFAAGLTATTIKASTIYSAAGTPLPTCNAGSNGTSAVVSDAAGATYAANYTSGGAQLRRVLCANPNWITN